MAVTTELTPAAELVAAIDATPAEETAPETSPVDAVEDGESPFLFTDAQIDRHAKALTALTVQEMEIASQIRTVDRAEDKLSRTKEAKEKDRATANLNAEKKRLEAQQKQLAVIQKRIADLEEAGRKQKAAKLEKDKKAADKAASGSMILAGTAALLTSEQLEVKANLESEIEVLLETAKNSAWQVAQKLGVIRDLKLYPRSEKNDAMSFNAYLEARWGMNKDEKNRLLAWLDTNQFLLTAPIDPDTAGSPAIARVPTAESQARELKRAGSLDNRAKVWREVLRRIEDKEKVLAEQGIVKQLPIEAAFIRQVVDEVIFGKNPNASPTAIEDRNAAIEAEVAAGGSNETKLSLLQELGYDELYFRGNHTYTVQARISLGGAMLYRAVIDGVAGTTIHHSKKAAREELEDFAHKQLDGEDSTETPTASIGLTSTDDGEEVVYYVGVENGIAETFPITDTSDYPFSYPEGKIFGPFKTQTEADSVKENINPDGDDAANAAIVSALGF